MSNVHNPNSTKRISYNSYTRDMTAAAGDVAYTGVGFKPQALNIEAVKDGAVEGSIGVAGWDGGDYAIARYSDNTYAGSTNLIFIKNVADTMSGVLLSYDVDGFTITWTKANAPTGTCRMLVTAFEG